MGYTPWGRRAGLGGGTEHTHAHINIPWSLHPRKHRLGTLVGFYTVRCTLLSFSKDEELRLRNLTTTYKVDFLYSQPAIAGG